MPRILLTISAARASPSTSSDEHDQRLAGLDDLLQDRQQLLEGGDLGVDDQDVRIVEHGLHALGVGDEVGRDVALVEPHALGELELQAEGVGLVDGDDTFLADLVHRLGDDLADRGVTGGDGGGGSDLLLGLHVLGGPRELGDQGGHGRLDAPLEAHRVGAGGHVAQALAHHGLSQHGGGGGAVARDVVGLLGDLLDELGADLLVRVLELDLLGDAHAVVGDGGRTPLLLEHDVAALRAQRDLDGVGELVHAALEAAPRFGVELNEFRHVLRESSRVRGLSPRVGVDRCWVSPAVPATDARTLRHRGLGSGLTAW